MKLIIYNDRKEKHNSYEAHIDGLDMVRAYGKNEFEVKDNLAIILDDIMSDLTKIRITLT